MSPNERRGISRWFLGPRGLMAFAAALLFVVMVVSFVNIPWGEPRCGGTLCEIPVTDSEGRGGSITGSLFGGYAVLVLLSALVLAACMIGGVYLAKSEGGGPP